MRRQIPAIRAGRWSTVTAKWSASSPRFSTPPASMSLPAWPSPCRSRMRPRLWETIRFNRGISSTGPLSSRPHQERQVMTTTGAHPGLEHLLYEVKKVVVGQDHFLERVLVALLAGGHLLVEGVPGLAKTLTVSTLARAFQGSFKRIQFTPDLVPADLTGTRIFNQKNSEFVTMLGPVFANLVLADEINRAPAKVQSALLEVMQERQVTIAGQTYPVPRPFVVMATQNPIETEGTYALPEAQVDRFMMKVLIGYPSEEEEFVIVQRVTGEPVAVGAVTTTDELLEMQKAARRLYVDPSLMIYAVKLVAATRAPEKCGLPQYQRFIQYGASPRASIAMIEAGRALAFIRGRDYVLPADVVDVAADVLRHRLVPSYEALSEGLTSDKIVSQIMRAVPPPVLETARAANL